MSQTSPGRALGVLTATPTLDGISIGGGPVLATMDIGSAATDKLGFYGATAATQRTSAAQTTIATTVWISGGVGFGSTAWVSALIATVQEIQQTLTALGLWKGS